MPTATKPDGTPKASPSSSSSSAKATGLSARTSSLISKVGAITSSTDLPLKVGKRKCEFCQEMTRCYEPTTGRPVCIACWRTIANWREFVRPWSKPPRFVRSRRASTWEHVVFRDGPANGTDVRRGSVLEERQGAIGKKKGKIVKTKVTWPVSGLLIRAGQLYAYEASNDSYWWVEP